MVDDCVFFILSQTATCLLYAISQSEALTSLTTFFSFLRLESVEDRHLTAPDPDPEIRGEGGGGLQKTFFRPFGPHFGLRLRGDEPPGTLPWICHCLNIQMTIQLVTEHLEALSLF